MENWKLALDFLRMNLLLVSRIKYMYVPSHWNWASNHTISYFRDKKRVHMRFLYSLVNLHLIEKLLCRFIFQQVSSCSFSQKALCSFSKDIYCPILNQNRSNSGRSCSVSSWGCSRISCILRRPFFPLPS